MGSTEKDRLHFVLRRLAARMITARDQLYPTARDRRSKRRTEPPGVVVVIGAGCSMQYGLPSFTELLGYAYDDLGVDPSRDPRWELDSLRDRLDAHWRVLKPSELRPLLRKYLQRIEGSNCTGYLRLACLARKGYIKAIVNMNFDRLLHEAFAAISNSDGRTARGIRTFRLDDHLRQDNASRLDFFRKHVPLFLPHGTLKEGAGVPILDLAGSDLFDTQEETKAAEDLFRNNDIVFLGYRGSDAKIAAALTPDKVPSDRNEVPEQNYNKIYVLNVDPPDPRLLRIMIDRRSTELGVTGNTAAFENVMEELDHAIRDLHQIDPRSWTEADLAAACSPTLQSTESARALPTNSRHFTRTDTLALDRCRDLAIHLRASMSIAEGGHISIEDHAKTIFDMSLEIARCAGIGLTTPEKYLLYCAAYLHDLGYFWAHSGAHKYEKAGWHLLSTHGEDTAKLLVRHFSESEAKLREAAHFAANEPTGQEQAESDSIFPESFEAERNALRDTLIVLCYLHSETATSRWPSSFELEGELIQPRTTFLVQVDAFQIEVRPPLIHALFSTAEELAHGHPFRPSPHPLEFQSAQQVEPRTPFSMST